MTDSMTLSARAYLSKKGTIELLCEIDPEGSRFGELLEELPISRPTLSQRLSEGGKLSLLEPQPISGEQGTTHEYVFTPKGATIRNLLFKEGLVLEYQQYKQARKQFEASSDEFRETMESNIPRLSNEELNEDNLRSILQRNALSDFLEE